MEAEDFAQDLEVARVRPFGGQRPTKIASQECNLHLLGD